MTTVTPTVVVQVSSPEPLEDFSELNDTVVVGARAYSASELAGVNFFSAGTGAVSSGGGFVGECSGVPGGSSAVTAVGLADDAGELIKIGTRWFDHRSYKFGLTSEQGTTPTADRNVHEWGTGLTNIDDFGASVGNDDDANAQLGTLGQLRVRFNNSDGHYVSVTADGVEATGVLGINRSTPAANLDGHEILIFEDGELSGMAIVLHSSIPDEEPFRISIEDLEYNPATANGADDVVIAIDLDGLPESAPEFIASIEIRDDGISRDGINSCDAAQTPNTVETSVKLDAITISRAGIASGTVTEVRSGS